MAVAQLTRPQLTRPSLLDEYAWQPRLTSGSHTVRLAIHGTQCSAACVCAQDLEVLILSIDLDCVAGLIEDGGIGWGLRLPPNDEFVLVRILVDLIRVEVVEILDLR